MHKVAIMKTAIHFINVNSKSKEEARFNSQLARSHAAKSSKRKVSSRRDDQVLRPLASAIGLQRHNSIIDEHPQYQAVTSGDELHTQVQIPRSRHSSPLLHTLSPVFGIAQLPFAHNSPDAKSMHYCKSDKYSDHATDDRSVNGRFIY